MRIYFIPNFGVKVSDNDIVLMPKGDVTLLKNLSNEGYNITIVAEENSNDDTFYDAGIKLSESSLINIKQPSKIQAISNRFASKIINFINTVACLLKVIIGASKNDFFYIYYPGKCGVIASLFCIVFRKQYSIYVRGSWLDYYPSKISSSITFFYAKWILTTGASFREKVSKYNNFTEPVAPMLSVGSQDLHIGSRHYTTIGKVLFLGHISKIKGIYDLLEALFILKKSGQEVILSIAGGGTQQAIDELMAKAKKLDINLQIDYLGHISSVEELETLLSKTSVFIYPSHYEGFPRVVYEAMLFGLPIVTTVLEGMKGFMKDRVNCLEIEVRNPQNLSEAIISILRDENLRRKIGLQAKNDVEEYLSSINGNSHSEQVIKKLTDFSNV